MRSFSTSFCITCQHTLKCCCHRKFWENFLKSSFWNQDQFYCKSDENFSHIFALLFFRILRLFNLHYREEEISLASPTSQDKSDIISGLASPRVKGRKEMKKDLDQSKQYTDQNGTVPSEEKIIEDLRTQKKGLKEYLKDSLIARKSPSNTDEGSSSKAGTLEHKRGRDIKLGHADLRQHMKLTERDIDALIKKEVLETIKNNSVPSKTVKDKKKSGKSSRKKIYASDDDDGDEIVVIRLDPSLETPKKSKRTKKLKDRQLENGVHGGETKTKEKKEKHLLDNSFQGKDTIERKHEKRTEKKEIKDEKTDKLKKDVSTGSLKKEKKTDKKDWPKVSILCC